MNLGIVLPGFAASDEDWCIPAITNLVRSLSERHDVRVVALRYPHRREPYRAHGARVFPVAGAQSKGLSRALLLSRAGRIILSQHLRRSFDVIHAFWADEPGYLAIQAARWLRRPAIVTIAGGELVAMPDIDYGGRTSILNRYFVSRALARAACVTAGSIAAALLGERYGGVTFLPLGVDLERFTPGPPTPELLSGSPKLLHVASLTPVKDQATLLRAFARTSQSLPRAMLHIVGDGPSKEGLKRLASELGVAKRVSFHGSVAHDALPDFYRSSDLLVMSSLYETQGLVVLEAAACRRTTAGTRVGAIADLNPATLPVEPRDDAALASAILDALRNPEALQERGLMAERRVRARYSLGTTVSALEALYEELATRYRRGGISSTAKPHATIREGYGRMGRTPRVSQEPP
ncbi:MAG TPA: glycosyltransferase [Vicinamibacteria bacterium]|nr:glycosyltransferase [Vicinamibacteria bacterium]